MPNRKTAPPRRKRHTVAQLRRAMGRSNKRSRALRVTLAVPHKKPPPQ